MAGQHRADPHAADLEALLARGLPGLGIVADEALITAFASFLRLLGKWNQSFNLTSIRDPADMVLRHILDSLTARTFLRGDRVLDVGCGAGLPGIPLALVEPGRQFTLIDSTLKKIRFVREAIRELHIGNAVAEHVRVEDYRPVHAFDTIICRALSSLADFVRGAEQLVAPGGCLVAMKGRYPADELAELPRALKGRWTAETVARVQVPGLEAERHMLVITRTAPAGRQP